MRKTMWHRHSCLPDVAQTLLSVRPARDEPMHTGLRPPECAQTGVSVPHFETLPHAAATQSCQPALCHKSQRGLSLIEVTVTLAVVSGLMLIVYSMLDQTLRASMFNESHNDLMIMAQRSVNRMQSEIVQSRLAYEENTDGAAYRTALQIPSKYPAWSNSLLPVIQADPAMGPDTTATRYTGNSMLLVRQLEPLSLYYDHDNNVNTPEIEFLADRYRFEYFFLSPNSTRKFASGATSVLDLIFCESEVYADYMQLSSLTAAQIQKIVPKVMNAKITRAWNVGQPIASAFYLLSDATDGTFNGVIIKPKIAIANTRSLFPELRGGRISGRMEYSIAFGSYPIRRAIPYYAKVDKTKPNFPGGFEVKICGPAGNRNVITRVLLMAHYGVTDYDSQQGFVTTAASF